jgi:cobalt/nickel transport system permease protein
MFIMLFSVQPLHIPDGFLSIIVSILFWIVTIIIIGYALHRVSRDLDERRVPLMGLLAAAIFAGQMLNFTVIGGTSGHLMGAAIATILLGPWAAVLVMTTVVGVQALIFQDGGFLAMGANIFNMAIIGVAASYFVYHSIRKLSNNKTIGLYIGAFLAAWISIFIASLSVALQLALSKTSPANIAVPAMAGIHALIGIGEGLITIGALSLILAARPDFVRASDHILSGGKMVWLGGAGLVVLLTVLSPLASSHPDGLERVAENIGFLEFARKPLFSLLPDYQIPGITNQSFAVILAGFLGACIVGSAALFLAFIRHSKVSTK